MHRFCLHTQRYFCEVLRRRNSRTPTNNRMNQLQIHKRIDDFLKADVTLASIGSARELMGYNSDAKRYFFSTANEQWIKWFYDNGLFAELKKKAEDPTKYGYRLPELEYLTRVAEKEPHQVANVILSVPISKETFNPEV